MIHSSKTQCNLKIYYYQTFGLRLRIFAERSIALLFHHISLVGLTSHELHITTFIKVRFIQIKETTELYFFSNIEIHTGYYSVAAMLVDGRVLVSRNSRKPAANTMNATPDRRTQPTS